MLRKFDPLPADHPLVGRPCAGCGEPFKEGDETTLVSALPDGPEEAQKALAGRPYRATAAVYHWGHEDQAPVHGDYI